MSVPSSRARGSLVGAVVAVIALTAGALYLRGSSTPKRAAAGPPCRVVIASATYRLDSEQAANATTVAAIGKRMGLADHAVTVALAAALQESGLHNLTHGDRDSLGLFQQRPSQGWGTPRAILTPRLAAAAFYEHLAKVDGWRTLSVSAAAQRVQRSAAPSAYADWEPEARDLAQAVTGEAPAALTCQLDAPSGGMQRAAVSQAIAEELGSPGTGTAVTTARGWTIASWLVGHAEPLRLSRVAFAARTWTRATGTWRRSAGAGAAVEYT